MSEPLSGEHIILLLTHTHTYTKREQALKQPFTQQHALGSEHTHRSMKMANCQLPDVKRIFDVVRCSFDSLTTSLLQTIIYRSFVSFLSAPSVFLRCSVCVYSRLKFIWRHRCRTLSFPHDHQTTLRVDVREIETKQERRREWERYMTYVRRCESLAVTRLRVSLFYFLGFSFWKFLFYCVNARTCSMLAHNTHLMSNICECECVCVCVWMGIRVCNDCDGKSGTYGTAPPPPMATYDWCSIQFIRFSANAHFTSYYDYYSLRETCQIEVNFPKIMWEKHTRGKCSAE